jgi:hypothetical protein
MDEDGLNEGQYRDQIRTVLADFVARRITSEMAMPRLMLLFPARDDASEANCATTLTMMLQDLAETPASLGKMVSEILGMVLDEVQHQASMSALMAAIAVLEARGRTVTQINAFGRFRVDGAGSYSVDDILAAAKK